MLIRLSKPDRSILVRHEDVLFAYQGWQDTNPDDDLTVSTIYLKTDDTLPKIIRLDMHINKVMIAVNEAIIRSKGS